MHKHEGSATDEQFRSELEALKVDDVNAYEHLLDDEVSPTNTKSLMKKIQSKFETLTTTEIKRPQNNDNDDHDSTHKRNKDDGIESDNYDNDDLCVGRGSDNKQQQRQLRQPQ